MDAFLNCGGVWLSWHHKQVSWSLPTGVRYLTHCHLDILHPMVSANIRRRRQRDCILRNATNHPISMRDPSGEETTVAAATSTSIGLRRRSSRITITCSQEARYSFHIDLPLVCSHSRKMGHLASGTPSFPFSVYTFNVSIDSIIQDFKTNAAGPTKRFILT